MNFIRLPSLRLSNQNINDQTLSDHNDGNSSAIDDSDKAISSGIFLPPTWKHNQSHYQDAQQQYTHQQPQLQPNIQHQQQQAFSPVGLRLQPYPQSYAQELFSFAALTDPPPTIYNNTNSQPSSTMTPPTTSNTRRRRRPPHSYASMIAQAILTSQDQKMSLRDIYTWVQQRYPHLYESNETGWKNTIRHNLSLNRCFYKLPKSSHEKGRGKGKGGYWAVSVSQLNSTTFGRHLLDSGSVAGFEYWPQEDSGSSSSTGDAPFIPESNNTLMSFNNNSGGDEDEDVSESFDSFHLATTGSNSSTTSTPTSMNTLNNSDNNNANLFLQPANFATLQNHQLHLQQRRNVPLPPTLSIPYNMNSHHHHHHYSANKDLDNPTFHPPSLHHILN
ncbi:unnamed protein product [Absidia cylindrospora]